MRIDICKLLSTISQIRQQSTSGQVITEPTTVLIKKPSMPSVNSAICGWQYWEVLCYVPSNDVLQLDELVDKVTKLLLSNGYEVTNSNTQEYYDDALKAFMISVEFRTIKLLF